MERRRHSRGMDQSFQKEVVAIRYLADRLGGMRKKSRCYDRSQVKREVSMKTKNSMLRMATKIFSSIIISAFFFLKCLKEMLKYLIVSDSRQINKISGENGQKLFVFSVSLVCLKQFRISQ